MVYARSEYYKIRYQEKKEHILSTCRAYRENNPDKRKEMVKAWDSSNKPRRAAIEAKRRATKLQATPQWLTEDDHANILKIYEYAHSLGYHVDHIVPLQSNKVCGLHVPWNLQPLEPLKNMSKNNRFEIEGFEQL